MLERDNYRPDYVLKYSPDYSLQKYQEYILGNKPFYRMIFSETERSRWEDRMNTVNNIIFVIFLASMLPIFLHTKIPGLKRFTSKKARLLFGICWVFIPSNLVGALLGRERNTEMTMSYNLNARDFRIYRQNKDLEQINPEMKLAEL